MPINTKSYRQSKNKSPNDKITQNSTSFINEIGEGVSSIAESVGTGLSEAGAAIGTAIDGVSSAVDGFFSGGGSFFKRSVERVSPTDLRSNRISGNFTSATEKVAASLQSFSGKSLVYPEDIGKYFMGLSFAEYTRPNGFEPPQVNLVDNIFLPLPENLAEQYGVEWNQNDTGIVGDLVGRELGTVKSAINNGGAIDEDAVKDAVYRGLGGAEAATTYLLRGTVDTISPGAGGILEQTTGYILNPHPSIFFKGISMREHNLSWKFSPSSDTESKILKDIFNRLKMRMLPKINDAGITASTLSYPHMVKPSIHPGTGYMYSFKWCGIKSMNIVYTPDGGPAFYKGTSAPVSMTLNMTLAELEYFTSNDERPLDESPITSLSSLY